jgi:hypothetical protein
VVVLLIPIGFLSKLCSQYLLSLTPFNGHAILIILFAGIVYLILVALTTCYLPSVAGLDTKQIHRAWIWVRSRLILGN